MRGLVDFFGLILITLLSVIFSGKADAVEQCTLYRVPYNNWVPLTDGQPTPAGACGVFCSAYSTNNAVNDCSGVSEVTPTSCKIATVRQSDGFVSSTTVSMSTLAGDCPDCADQMDTIRNVAYSEAQYPGDTFCDDGADSGSGVSCMLEHTGPKGVCFQQPSGNCLVTYKVTGEGCGTPLPPDVELDDQGDGVCRSTAGGVVCVGYRRDAKNCGSINGEDVCLGEVPDGRCMFLGDGGMACDSTAGSPPGPDDGVTPGTPPTPVAQLSTVDPVTGLTTNTYNIYSSSQVTNSGVSPEGASPSSGPGTGNGEGEGGTGTASGGATCDAAPTCDGDPIQCAILEQEWLNRCTDTPTEAEGEELAGGPIEPGEGVTDVEIGSLSTTRLGNDSGSCPAAAQVEIFGTIKEIPFTFICQWALLVRPLIILAGYLHAAFLVFGAFRA